MSTEVLIDVADEPADRVEALAGRIEDYQRRYERQRDSRAVFAFAYRNLTLDLADRLAATDTGFDDPEWVADLGLAFGGRFVAAMDAIDDWLAADGESALSEHAPTPWADVYAAIDGWSLVIEDLVFAMGAHISYDLPMALQTVDHADRRLGDYHEMNEVLAANTESIQAAVTRRYNPLLGRFDRLLGPVDEQFTGYAIRLGRSVAWYNARRLANADTHRAAKGSITRSTAALIDSVRRPGSWWLRLGSKIGRTLAHNRRWSTPRPPEEAEETGREFARWEVTSSGT